MTRALTLEDIDRLGELLASIPEPFVPMEPDMLDGYLTAIALLRHPPRIEDWIGLVFDIEGRTRASLASEEMHHELRKLVLARGAEIEQLILTQKPIDPIIFEDEPENPEADQGSEIHHARRHLGGDRRRFTAYGRQERDSPRCHATVEAERT